MSLCSKSCTVAPNAIPWAFQQLALIFFAEILSSVRRRHFILPLLLLDATMVDPPRHITPSGRWPWFAHPHAFTSFSVPI